MKLWTQKLCSIIHHYKVCFGIVLCPYMNSVVSVLVNGITVMSNKLTCIALQVMKTQSSAQTCNFCLLQN